METNKKILPKSEDNISYLYIEYAKIEREDFAIVIIRDEYKILVPVAKLNTLMLGPGTSITHGAVNVISSSGCNIIWCGDHMTRFYSYDDAEIRNSKNLLKQIEYYANEEKRMQIVRKMYKKRFKDIDVNSLSLKELRGIEGINVKEVYKFYAKVYKVKWSGRNSKVKDIDRDDFINFAITILNQSLYAICHGIILSLGFSPAIGFIHTGNMESFVFDISDFYKENIIIPMAFRLHSSFTSENIERICRKEFRKEIVNKRLVTVITRDVLNLFNENEKDIDYSVNTLWDIDQVIPGGKNYGDEL